MFCSCLSALTPTHRIEKANLTTLADQSDRIPQLLILFMLQMQTILDPGAYRLELSISRSGFGH